MSTKIFINLPVKNLDQTIQFFTKLGFRFNPRFTDENGTCMIISKDIFVMLLDEKFFKTFTKKEITDAKKSTEVILALSAEDRKAVDDLIRKVVKAGGQVHNQPQDDGWMYGHGFQDLDGHQWEVVYMKEQKI